MCIHTHSNTCWHCKPSTGKFGVAGCTDCSLCEAGQFATNQKVVESTNKLTVLCECVWFYGCGGGSNGTGSLASDFLIRSTGNAQAAVNAFFGVPS